MTKPISNKYLLNNFVTRYQSTQSALKSTAEKTTSILGGFTSGISSKLSQMKKSDSYRSIEERVGSAYENVKVKVNKNQNQQFKYKTFSYSYFLLFTFIDQSFDITFGFNS